jgi:hypothetical protein
MKNTASMPRPPITRLRPLHSHQQLSNQELERRSPNVQDHFKDDPQLLHWSSTLEPRPYKETSIKAFVKLVSRIVVLDPGETYCIQDSTRGGFILARSVRVGHEGRQQDEEDGGFSFIACADHVIPTDFSIGGGKVS